MASGTLTANGSTIIATTRGADRVRSLYLFGTFSSGLVVVEASPDGTEWFEVSRTSAKTVFGFQGRAFQIRLTLSGASTPSISWALL